MKKTGSGMIIYDSKIVLFGGSGKSGMRTNELHTFNLRKVKDSTLLCILLCNSHVLLVL